MLNKQGPPVERKPAVKESLVEQKNKLFQDIVEQLPHLDRERRRCVLARVFGNAVEDGLDLSDRLALGSKDILDVMKDSNFLGMHRGFGKDLYQTILELRDATDLDDVSYTGVDQEAKILKSKLQHPLPKDPDYRLNKFKDIKPLEEEIDRYYENFIKTKKLKAPEENGDVMSPGQRVALEQMQSLYYAKEPYYYTGHLKDLFWQWVIKENGLAKDAPYDESFIEKEYPRLKFPTDNIIQRSRLFDWMGILGMYDDDFKKFARDRYRPLDVTTMARQKVAHEMLIKEIQASVAKREHCQPSQVEVEKDEKGAYRVTIQPKKEKESQEERDKMREWKDFDARAVNGVRNKPLDYTIVNGKPAFLQPQKWYDEENDKYYNGSVIQYDGKQYGGKDLVPYSGPFEFKNGLAFFAKIPDDGRYVLFYDEGKLMPCTIDEAPYTEGQPLFKVVGDDIYVKQIFPKKLEVVSVISDKVIPMKEDVRYLQYYNIEGKLVIVTRNRREKGEFIVDGVRQEFPSDIEPDIYAQPVLIDGKLFFRGTYKDAMVLVSEGKIIYGPDQGFDQIYSFSKCNGKLVFYARTVDGEVVVYDGKVVNKLLPEHDIVSPLIEVNGRLAYIERDLTPERYHRTTIEIYDPDKNSTYTPIISGDVESFKAKDGLLLIERNVEDGKILMFSHYSEPKSRTLTSDEVDNESGKLGLLYVLDHVGEMDAGDLFNEIERRSRGFVKEPAFSPETMRKLNASLENEPAAFRGMFPVKRDPTSSKELEKIVYRLFPELKPAEQEKVAAGFWERTFGKWFGRRGPTSSIPMPSASAYVTPKLETAMTGGDPREMAKNGETVLEMREPLEQGIISTGLFGAYDSTTRQWRKVMFPVAPEVGAIDERTFTITNVKGLKDVRLPTVIGAKFIEDRVRGVDKKKKETPLKVHIDPLGEARVELPPGHNFTSLMYSLEVPRVSPALTPLTAKVHARLRETFTANHGQDMLSSLATLPEECDVFLASIKKQSPEEQVMAIENYVREISYYDFEHGEVAQKFNDADPEGRLSLMRERLKEVMEKKSEIKDRLQGKMFAGVCADFAILTTTLLRRAGFVSGMLEGFRPSGAKVTTADAHGTSFVVWPNEQGRGFRVIPVDGTPGGLSPEEQKQIAVIQQPTLAERAADKQEEIEDLAEFAIEEFAEEEKILKQNDVKKIQQLTNSDIERVVNHFLTYVVRRPHVSSLMRVLNASRYAPTELKFATLDFNDPIARKKFEEFIELEIRNERKASDKQEVAAKEPPGTQFMNAIQEFVKRFSKDQEVGGRKEALALLGRLIDASASSLSKQEHQAAAAVITYLTTKKMGH